MKRAVRLPLLVGLAMALAAALPEAGAAQLSPGVHGVRARDLFAGADGLGIRLAVGSPLPVKVVANADWFFPRCDGRCRYEAASVDVHVPVAPIPVLNPYALGGYTWRRFEPVGALDPVVERGIGLGLGVHLGTPGFGLYLETRYEFLGRERQWVSRLGVEF